jgi:Zn-dependent peptidase ImmA (M78 family)
MFKIEKCIKNVLRESDKTAEGLAAEAGMTKQTLYRLFNKDDAKLSQLNELAKALGVSIYDTFESPGQPKKEVKYVKVEEEADVVAVELLMDRVEELKDHNQSLKKYVASLERELERYHKDSDQENNRSSRQTG